MKLAASYLAIEENFEKNLQHLLETEIDYLHVDVMDGVFVSKKTISEDILFPILQHTTKPLDVHLMVKDLSNYIEKYAILHPKYITFHLEATAHTEEIISLIRSLGIGVGLAINPTTDVRLLKPYLHQVDMVLVMSVIAGAGGQKFDTGVIDKIEWLKNEKDQCDYHYQIEVDGGIKNHNISLVDQVDMVVVGSYLTSSTSYPACVSQLKNTIEIVTNPDLKKVKSFCKKQHEGQKRFGGTPYYHHPYAVAGLLADKGFDQPYLMAAYLHDTLEDTDATEEEIKRVAGPEVLEAVVLLTKTERYETKDYLDQIKTNHIAYMVKLADRYHNLRESLQTSLKFQIRYLEESKQHYLDFSKETVFEQEMVEAICQLEENVNRLQLKDKN